MSDVKEVISGLQGLHGSVETMELLSETVSLLNRYIPLQPITRLDMDGWTEYYCGSCKQYLLNYKPGLNIQLDYQKYCCVCGQAVKWDE